MQHLLQTYCIHLVERISDESEAFGWSPHRDRHQEFGQVKCQDKGYGERSESSKHKYQPQN